MQRFNRSFILLTMLVLLAAYLQPATPVAAQTPTVWTVTNISDSGTNSLRWAITQANNSAGSDRIEFNISAAPLDGGYWSIALASPLPELTGGSLTIDGLSQPGGRGDGGPKIELDGYTNTVRGEGILIKSSNNVIRGLIINGFDDVFTDEPAGGGVAISGYGVSGGANNNRVEHCYIGTDYAGNLKKDADDSSIRNDRDGISIVYQASGNVIDNNVISANRGVGVYIGQGSLDYGNFLAVTSDNTVSNNLIGLTADGSQALANASHGVLISENANNNTIGPGNTISGNGGSSLEEYGVRIEGKLSAGDGGRIQNNQVIGNYIGTNKAGTASVPNSDGGVNVRASRGTVVGGSEAQRNIIAGNSGPGVLVDNFEGEMQNIRISHNWIGLNAAGTQPLPNTRAGVQLECGTTATTVGPANVIGGHTSEGSVLTAGVLITGRCTNPSSIQKISTANTVTDNLIGRNAANTAAVPNRYGIELGYGVTNNTLSKNRIQGNDGYGVLIWNGTTSTTQPGPPPTDNLVEDNIVRENGVSQGVNGDGIRIRDDAVRNRVRRTATTRNGNGLNDAEGRGINLVEGGNNDISAPVVSNLAVTGTQPNLTLTGTVSNGQNCGTNQCTVEVFDNDRLENYEGPNYLATFATSGSGSFSVNFASCQPFLTFTITDQNGNTSPFTQAFGSFAACNEVTPSYGVSWNPGSRSGTLPASSTTITYEHRLRNDGNQQDTFTLAPTTVPAGVTVRLVPATSITLNPGAEQNVQVVVTIGSGVTSSPVVTRVTATSQGNSSVSAVASQSTTVSLVPRPELTPATLSDAGKPQETIVYAYTLKNVGNGTGTFNLAVSGLPTGWNATVSPAQVTNLAAGNTASVEVRVTIPANATTDAPAAVGTLTASASGGTASAQFTTAVELVPNLSFTPASQSQSAGRNQTIPFTHTLTNLGNGPDTFAIAVTPPAGWGVSVQPVNPISLERNASTVVTVVYTVPGSAVNGIYNSTVKASSNADPAVSQTVTDTIEVVNTAVPRLDAPLTVAIDPGEVVTLTHTLTNVGDLADDFDFALLLPSGLELQSFTPPSPVSLAIGATTQITTVIRATTDALAADYAVTLRVTAQATQGGIKAQAQVVDTVTVNKIPDLDLIGPADDRSKAGRVISYTFELRNDGNFTDTISLELTSSQGWDVAIPDLPTLAVAIPARQSRELLVTVTVPRGAPVDLVNTTTLTATSSIPTEQVSATVNTTVDPTPEVTLDPELIEQFAVPGEIITFTFYLTNTGNVVQSYDLTTEGVPDGWISSVAPENIANFDPGQATPVLLSLQSPENASFGPVDVTLRAASTTDATVADTVIARYRIGSPYSVEIAPDNSDEQIPGQTVVYTHQITNTGRYSDTYSLFTLSTLGWESLVTPATIFLEPGASSTISVTVLVPPGATAGVVDTTTIKAESDADPEVTGQARNRTRVLQIGGVSFAPGDRQLLVPDSEVVFQHSVINIGNGLDSFVITATQQLDWAITLEPDSTPVLQRGLPYAIEVRVQIPADAALTDVNRIRVRAISQFDPTVYEELVNVISQDIRRTEPASVIYLPVVRNARR